MQTFLPYPGFAESAAVLDGQRLGKQRVETLQILRALTIPDYGWQSHPAVRMWMGHVPALASYGLAMAEEWLRRGHQDSTYANIAEFGPAAGQQSAAELPPWLGDPDLHRSHRSNLIRKDPLFYAPRFPSDDGKLDYVWPQPKEVLLPSDPAAARIWILRMEVAALQSMGMVMAIQAPSGRRSPKRNRQVEAFRNSIHIGESVAVPVPRSGPAGTPTLFRTATVTGAPVEAGPGVLLRPVCMGGELQRSDFPSPALLQDPRALFAVPAPVGAGADG